jgi:hypothetical protein
VEADEGLLTAAAPRYFATNLLLINHSDVKGRGSHDVSLDRPENALASDVFGHNRKQRFGYENTGRHFNSRATHHYWGSLYRPASDQRPGDRAKGELGGVFIALLLGDDSDALSLDQFLRLISVPAMFAAFLIASQISAALAPYPA